MNPRLLYLTHRVPYPPDKGDRIRNFHVLRELAKVARVALVSLADEPVSSGTLAKLNGLCETVEIVPSSGKRRWLRAGRSLLLGRSLSEGLFADPALDATLARLAKATAWDASLVSASSLTPYQQRHGLPAKPRFVDLVDVDSQKWFDYADAASGPKHALYSLEGHRVRKLEKEIAQWATATFIVSPAECGVFDSFAHAGAGSVATNGVDLDFFQPRLEVRTRPVCAFVGTGTGTGTRQPDRLIAGSSQCNVKHPRTSGGVSRCPSLERAIGRGSDLPPPRCGHAPVAQAIPKPFDQALPTVPIRLTRELRAILPLEAGYEETCRFLRIA